MKNRYWFTFIELIIVFLLLAIFTSFASLAYFGYAKNARDLTRISDLKRIQTALLKYKTDSQRYPWIVDFVSISDSGSKVSIQGEFNDSIASVLSFEDTPKDPLTKENYLYSVNNVGDRFSLLSYLEDNVDGETVYEFDDKYTYVMGDNFFLYEADLTPISSNVDLWLVWPSSTLIWQTSSHVFYWEDLAYLWQSSKNCNYAYKNKVLTSDTLEIVLSDWQRIMTECLNEDWNSWTKVAEIASNSRWHLQSRGFLTRNFIDSDKNWWKFSDDQINEISTGQFRLDCGSETNYFEISTFVADWNSWPLKAKESLSDTFEDVNFSWSNVWLDASQLPTSNPKVAYWSSSWVYDWCLINGSDWNSWILWTK